MAMVQCHYEINVSKRVVDGDPVGPPPFPRQRYVHLFATAERSCVSEQAMQDVYREIAARFPWPQYHVEVTQIECSGRKIAAPLPGEGRQLPDVRS